MEITRREAIVGLAIAGVGVELVGDTDEQAQSLVATLLAAADVVAPPAVDVSESFVRGYVLGRARVDAEYERHIAEAASRLDAQAHREYQSTFASLTPSERRQVFRSLGVHLTHADPDGVLSQRIRYYVVNDLKYVLYSTPLGGRTVGVENPPGYPGGREAYQRGPTE